MTTPFRKIVASVAALSVASTLSLPITASAAMLGTETLAPSPAAAVDAQAGDAARAQITTALQREDIQAQLVQRGLSPEQAAERVQALTDAQAVSLAHRLDQLPAGGSVLGTIGLILVILVVTDLLGWTDVYPFINPVR